MSRTLFVTDSPGYFAPNEQSVSKLASATAYPFQNLSVASEANDTSLLGTDGLKVRDSIFPLGEPFFSRRQPILHDFQIVIAVAKFNHQFGQGNQMLHLEAQWPTPAAAHGFQFRPLLIGHTNVESDVFLCHFPKAAKAKLLTQGEKGLTKADNHSSLLPVFRLQSDYGNRLRARQFSEAAFLVLPALSSSRSVCWAQRTERHNCRSLAAMGVWKNRFKNEAVNTFLKVESNGNVFFTEGNHDRQGKNFSGRV